jgi:hypothetical protein
VANAYLDQLQRTGGLQASVISAVRSELEGNQRNRFAVRATELEVSAASAESGGRAIDARRITGLAQTLRQLAGEEQPD